MSYRPSSATVGAQAPPSNLRWRLTPIVTLPSLERQEDRQEREQSKTWGLRGGYIPPRGIATGVRPAGRTAGLDHVTVPRLMRAPLLGRGFLNRHVIRAKGRLARRLRALGKARAVLVRPRRVCAVA